MRLFITLTRKHGAKSFDMVVGPDRPYSDHRAFWEQHTASREHPNLEEIQVWDANSGLGRRRRFLPAAPQGSAEEALVDSPRRMRKAT